MWRHSALCNHCDKHTVWQRDREPALQEMIVHLKAAHHLANPREGSDFQIRRERLCDYCLEPYVDRCTKCDRDFCALHAGDIDGLCGGCI